MIVKYRHNILYNRIIYIMYEVRPQYIVVCHGTPQYIVVCIDSQTDVLVAKQLYGVGNDPPCFF